MEQAVVTQLAAGEAHTLALTVNGAVYSWGRGMFGRLGTGKESDEPSPVHISFDSGVATMEAVSTSGRSEQPEGVTLYRPNGPELKMVAIAAGAYHSLALAGLGFCNKVGDSEEQGCMPSDWKFQFLDRWTDGQLGRDGPPLKPGRVNLLKGSLASDKSPAFVQDGENPEEEMLLKGVAVGAGGMMSCVIDEDGVLWFWNSEKHVSCPVFGHPEVVRGLEVRSEVLKVACGSEHVLALVQPIRGAERVACYSWGDNRHGQLGLGHLLSMATPQLVAGRVSSKVDWSTLIACGAFHSVVVTSVHGANLVPPYDPGASVCWTFGQGENGQLGHGVSVGSVLPEPVEGLPETDHVVAVDCGLFHTSVELSSGSIWAWGMEGGFGLCPAMGASGGDALAPVQIFCKRIPLPSAADGTSRRGRDTACSRRYFSSTLVCGAAHTVALDCNGLLMWAWGRGQHGALGSGAFSDSWVPCQVKWPPLVTVGDESTGLGIQPVCGTASGHDVDPPGGGDTVARGAGADHQDSLYDQALKEIGFLNDQLTSVRAHADLLNYTLYGTSSLNQATRSTRNEGNGLHSGQGFTAGSQKLLDDWERGIEQASDHDLAHLESFYRQMRGKVKDVIMRRKTELWCRLYLGSGLAAERPLLNQGGGLLFNAPGIAEPPVHSDTVSYTAEELDSLSQKLRRL